MTAPATLVRFAAEHGATIEDVRRFRRIGRLRAKYVEHELNGDPHPLIYNKNDKNANASAWSKEADKHATTMSEIAAKWGYTLDFGVGLYPTLEQANRVVLFPYD